MSVEGLFVHGGDLWQLKHHHHAFSHHNKGSPISIQIKKINTIIYDIILLIDFFHNILYIIDNKLFIHQYTKQINVE
ncbi:hypothetical protein CRH02_22645 [Escherichia albertii]|nr:hypothetical protein CRH02_22645 [Escherichia albertii]